MGLPASSRAAPTSSTRLLPPKSAVSTPFSSARSTIANRCAMIVPPPSMNAGGRTAVVAVQSAQLGRQRSQTRLGLASGFHLLIGGPLKPTIPIDEFDERLEVALSIRDRARHPTDHDGDLKIVWIGALHRGDCEVLAADQIRQQAHVERQERAITVRLIGVEDLHRQTGELIVPRPISQMGETGQV